MKKRITRRWFVGRALTAAGAIAAAPAILRGQNLNNKLNIAIIGAGGRGITNTKGVASENIVVLCDVDRAALDKEAAKHPKAKTLVDFRKVFDRPDAFDAVVVSTCEHTHVFATLLALNEGGAQATVRSGVRPRPQVVSLVGFRERDDERSRESPQRSGVLRARHQNAVDH